MKNPADLTKRNNDARKKDIAALQRAVRELRAIVSKHFDASINGLSSECASIRDEIAGVSVRVESLEDTRRRQQDHRAGRVFSAD